jgi:hypothetical protein
VIPRDFDGAEGPEPVGLSGGEFRLVDLIPSLFRGDYRPSHRPEHMTMLRDSLRKAALPVWLML